MAELRSLAVVIMVLLTATIAHAQSSLPNPNLTPGAINPAVSPDTIHQTICIQGWTRTIRPPVSVTNALKRLSIAQYGYTDRDPNDYQGDHLVPLSLGGHPVALENFWAEPVIASDTWRADDKDELERVLNHRVCSGILPLETAQAAIAENWQQAYTFYVTNGE